MNTKAHEQLVLDIFRQAIDDQPIPEGPHVAEDAELLACWSADLLRPSQNEQIAEHLAVCPYCRQELAEMIQSGMLDRSQDQLAVAELARVQDSTSCDSGTRTEQTACGRHGTDTDDRPPDRPSPTSSLRPWYRAPWVPMVLAASLLLAVGALFWYSRPLSPGSLLAQAEGNLQDGQALKALDTAERLLAGELSVADRVHAQQLLEQAGYRAATSALHAEDFGQVLDLEQRVARRTSESGRMANLRLQAERGVPAASSLDQRGSLLKYDYLPDGSLAGIKEFEPYDNTTKRLMQEFDEAVSKHPDLVPLWLNYGQFLLTHLEVERAEEQFAAALALNNRSAEAHLGLGLVAFERKAYDRALEHFQQVVGLDPDRADGHINVAVCLERLGRPNDARRHWERVLGLCHAPDLREQIEHHLGKGV